MSSARMPPNPAAYSLRIRSRRIVMAAFLNTQPWASHLQHHPKQTTAFDPTSLAPSCRGWKVGPRAQYRAGRVPTHC